MSAVLSLASQLLIWTLTAAAWLVLAFMTVIAMTPVDVLVRCVAP